MSNPRNDSSFAFSANWQAYSLIMAMLLFAHSPVLLNDYLRQDDWTGTFWNRSNLNTHPDLFNAAVELFRPVSVVLTLLSDTLNYHMEYAWITRLVNVLLLGVCAVLLYVWQIRCGARAVFAGCFAICAFMMPSSQLEAATGVYALMIVSILLSECACFLFYRGFLDRGKRTRWYVWGGVLLLLSLLDYPLGATYLLLFLFIFFLSHPEEKWWRKNSFMFHAIALLLLLMLVVLVAAKLSFFLFHIVPRDPQRAVAFDYDIVNKLVYWRDMLQQAFNFYAFVDFLSLHRPISFWWPPLIFGALFAVALVCRARVGAVRNGASDLVMLGLGLFTFLFLLTLAFSPAFPPHYGNYISFRYWLVIAPMAFYTTFWSCREIAVFKGISENCTGFQQSLCAVTLCLALFCAYNTQHYLSGFADHELNAIRTQVEQEAIPALKKGQPVTLYLVNAKEGRMGKGTLIHEYGFGIADFTPNVLTSAAVYVMREFHVESIETQPPVELTEWTPDRIRLKTSWGYIYCDQYGVKPLPVPAGTKEVLIDFAKTPKYW